MSFGTRMRANTPKQRMLVYLGIAGLALLPKSVFHLVDGAIVAHKTKNTDQARYEARKDVGVMETSFDAGLITLGLTALFWRNNKKQKMENAH